MNKNEIVINNGDYLGDYELSDLIKWLEKNPDSGLAGIVSNWIRINTEEEEENTEKEESEPAQDEFPF